MLLCLDTSALVKLLVEEAGSDLVARVWDGADVRMTSRLAVPEVAAALHAARRAQRLGGRELRAAMTAWQQYLPALRFLEVTPTLAAQAADLTATHALGGADAVHLAGVLSVRPAGPVLAVWDKRLHAGALAVGVRTLPATV